MHMAATAVAVEETADTKNIDKAALFLAHAGDYEILTPEQEQRLKRKIDWIIIPMLFVTATLGAVDKVALSTAAIYGLQEDNGLHGQQYSWLGSILSLGALVGMFPSSYLVHKFPAAKYLCTCSVAWSVMALLMPACSNWGGLMALRFLMGAAEAIIVPGSSLIISGWYKKNEQPPRNAFVFAAMSSVVNGFLSWAVGHISDDSPLAKWQYLYLIVGSISMAWSIFALSFLPDTPMNAIFLTQQEKVFWVQRLEGNKTGIVNNVWKWEQVLEAVPDPKTWLIFFFNIAINIPNGSSLLAMPTGVISTLAALTFSYLAAKWNDRRCLVTMIACTLPIAGTAVLYAVSRTAVPAQLVGLYLCYTYFGSYVVGISLAQANTAGHTKKNVQFAIQYVGYAVGNLIGPQTFRANQAPAYTGGVVAMLACYCVCISLIAACRFFCVAMNRKFVPTVPAVELDGTVVENFNDLTDFNQEGFRYTT
ncbi:MFS transporter [Bimuria novae-zelandiae CBS 107.79]|uniref:MFS transporter n=1 Tax=Bimuria novae-zelandiae CBS 107.79 TaxID=1447943 RepID=A0A6A5V6U7_9PLEO|nr:MFS transporter [Bimuria novae-zelandiae CBS 107.79]